MIKLLFLFSSIFIIISCGGDDSNEDDTLSSKVAFPATYQTTNFFYSDHIPILVHKVTSVNNGDGPLKIAYEKPTENEVNNLLTIELINLPYEFKGCRNMNDNELAFFSPDVDGFQKKTLQEIKSYNFILCVITAPTNNQLTYTGVQTFSKILTSDNSLNVINDVLINSLSFPADLLDVANTASNNGTTTLKFTENNVTLSNTEQNLFFVNNIGESTEDFSKLSITFFEGYDIGNGLGAPTVFCGNEEYQFRDGSLSPNNLSYDLKVSCVNIPYFSQFGQKCTTGNTQGLCAPFLLGR